MRAIVSKFGGSATAGAEGFRQILSIMDSSPSRRCAVLSAPGIDADHPEKVTGMLERCWMLRDQPEALRAAIEGVIDRFDAIARSLSLFDIRRLCAEEITAALFISREHTLSRGEYLCAALFGAWSGVKALDAADFIAFDATGRLDEAQTLSRLGSVARGRARTVLPGFYGADSSGRVFTFPRNGSDITGALAAAGMDAGLYENWTDVPGLMTADPAIVPNARLIPQISYSQMRQLARAGARILHPACLDPVAMAGIPTRLRCAHTPECFGTLIDDSCGRIVPCIAGAREADASELSGAPGRISRVSVFALDKGSVARAAKRLHPRAIRSMRGQTDVYIERDAFEEAMRTLHRKLLE